MTDRFICTNPKHSHGGGCFRTCACRCDVCRAYNNEYRKRYDHERNVFLGRGSTIIPAGPTTARLRALAWMGWSPAELARRYATSASTLSEARLALRPGVQIDTHRIVARAFSELWGVRPEGKSARQTRAYARRMGWLSPMQLNVDDLREVTRYGTEIPIRKRALQISA